MSRSRASRVVSRLCQYCPKRAVSAAATCPTKVCLFLLAVVRSSRSTRYRRAIPSFTFIDSFAAHTSRNECDRSDYFCRNYISKVIRQVEITFQLYAIVLESLICYVCFFAPLTLKIILSERASSLKLDVLETLAVVYPTQP